MTGIPEDHTTVVPRPDPTVLTTQQLLREIATSREIVETRVGGEVGKVETRLNGMDKAIELLQNTTDKFPDHVVQAVARLQELHAEKFKSIETQFIERDTRTEQTSRDSKVAVDAALKAQQEAFSEQNKSSALAISKSETATTKQIDQIGITMASNTKAMDDKIDDLKERITSIESSKVGSSAGLGIAGQLFLGFLTFVAVAVATISLVVTLLGRGGHLP